VLWVRCKKNKEKHFYKETFDVLHIKKVRNSKEQIFKKVIKKYYSLGWIDEIEKGESQIAWGDVLR
jgi:hypothetical protein